MQDPILFYKEELSQLETLLQRDKKRLNLLSFLRLLTFLGTGFLVYFFFDTIRIAIIIAIIGVIVFIVLLKSYLNRKADYDLNKELKAINEEELNIAKGDYLERKNGLEFLDPNHFYSSEIKKIKTEYTQKLNGIPRLTTREKTVLLEIAKGLSSIEIAKKLFISHNTVRTHRKHIMSKMDVTNTVTLIQKLLFECL